MVTDEQRAIYGLRDVGLEGVKERRRKNQREESNENECVYTDIQRPGLNEMDSV